MTAFTPETAKTAGAKGGKIVSTRKAKAAKLNGRNGGRPFGAKALLEMFTRESRKIDWQSLTPDQRKEWLPRFKRMDEIIDILSA